MSYDLYMLECKDGENLNDAVIRFTSEQEEELNPGFLDNVKEQRKQNLASKIIERNPGLEIFSFDYQQIASIHGMSAEEARIKYRHIEINGPEDSNGIQIELYDESAAITVPYWHKGVKAEDTFQEIWQYLKLLEQEAGYFPYDPQLGKALDLDSDFSSVLSSYEGIMLQIDEQIIKPMQRPKKSWWRFWQYPDA